MRPAKGVVSPVGDVVQDVFHDRQNFEKKKRRSEEYLGEFRKREESI